MIIIAESGATKTDWRSLHKDGSVTSVQTEGLNPMVMSHEVMNRVIGTAIPAVNPSGTRVSQVFFYGAGLVSPDAIASLASIIEISYFDIFRYGFISPFFPPPDIVANVIAEISHNPYDKDADCRLCPFFHLHRTVFPPSPDSLPAQSSQCDKHSAHQCNNSQQESENLCNSSFHDILFSDIFL